MKTTGRAEPPELERQGWQALSSTPDRALDFYRRVLDDPVLMVLPGGLLIDDRAAALEAMSGQPWSSYRLADERVHNLAPDVVAVVYSVAARRGNDVQSALVSSTYRRSPDGWRLAVHQQTPR